MPKLNIDISISLESQLDRLAFESNFVTNLVDQFKTVIPNLAVKLNDSANGFKSNFFDKPRVKEIKSAYNDAKAVIPHADFLNYSNMLVSVPEGFKGNFVEYLNLLIKLSPVIYKEANAFIAEYNFTLADFLTNKEAKKSNLSHDVVYRKISASREANVKEIEHYFSANSNSSKIKLGNLIGRFADLGSLADTAVALERMQSISNLQELADGINKSIFLLDTIKKNLENDSITEVNGVTAASISNGAYEVAKYVEFVSVFRFKCDQAVTSVENTLTAIHKAIHSS